MCFYCRKAMLCYKSWRQHCSKIVLQLSFGESKWHYSWTMDALHFRGEVWWNYPQVSDFRTHPVALRPRLCRHWESCSQNLEYLHTNRIHGRCSQSKEAQPVWSAWNDCQWRQRLQFTFQVLYDGKDNCWWRENNVQKCDSDEISRYSNTSVTMSVTNNSHENSSF